MSWRSINYAWLVSVALAICAGCQTTNQRSTLDPFLRPATVPAPPTGAAVPPAGGDPYYSAPATTGARPASPYSPPGGFNSGSAAPPPPTYYQQGATTTPKLSGTVPAANNAAVPASYNQPIAPNRSVPTQPIPTQPMPLTSPPRLVTLDPRPAANSAAPISTASAVDITELPGATRR